MLLSQIEVLEKHLEQQLVKQIPGFSMDAFTHSLKYAKWIHPLFLGPSIVLMLDSDWQYFFYTDVIVYTVKNIKINNTDNSNPV